MRLALKIFVSIIAAVIFVFSVSCGTQEEAGPEEAPPAQEGPPAAQQQIEELETELAEKNETIEELEQQNEQLETQVPVSRDVVQGDSHWGIAYDYLTHEEGLSSQEAREYLSKALLFHPILVGFRVWNYFQEGIFGSFVTQGTADISPGAVMRHEKQEAAEMKTGLQNRIEKLNAENREMGEKLDQMQVKYQEEKSEFQEQIGTMESDLEEARGDIQELESALSSVYYLAGTESRLKQEGMIEGSFLGICGKRIGDVVSTDFTKSLNLNQSDRITLNAEDYGLSRISSVGILPQHFQEGQDYRIEYTDGGMTAELILMGMEKYRMARLVIFLK